MRSFLLILALLAGCSSSTPTASPAPAASAPSKASPYVQQKASDAQGQNQ